MRPDLLEAQASLDWPLSQFVNFNDRLEAWLKASVRVEIRDVPPPATHNPIVAVETELLPLAFSVEAGAYINAIRSSLDILAMVLARRHGLAIPEDKVSFPFFRSKEAFEQQRGGLLLQHLPATDRALIENLKPYPRGNPDLWALHNLDILRKHRRLLDVRIQPIHISMAGSLKPDDFVPLATGIIQVNDETVLGLLRKGVPEPVVQSRFYVALSEQTFIKRRPVLATLVHLSDVASGVIRLFDR